jgi:outer membrane protein TolC
MRKLLFILSLIFSTPTAARPISAKDVIRLTREQSPAGLAIQLIPKAADYDIEIAKSQYDLNLKSQINHTVDKSERTSTIFGTASTMTNVNVGATQLTPSGAILDLSFNNIRQTSNSPFVTSSPVYDARTVLNVTQPILKNHLGTTTRATITLARKRREVLAYQAKSDLQDLTYKNLVTYWNWHLQLNLYQLNSEAVTLARRTLLTNQEKLSRGLLERIDLYAFAANLNLQENHLLTVKEQIIKLENDLKYALGIPDESIRPAKNTRPSPKGPDTALIAEALNSNPILATLRKDLEAHDISLVVQKNSRLPSLDLVGSLTLNGIDPGYGNAVNDIGGGHPIWAGGVNFSFPLQNRAATAGVKKLGLQKKQKLYFYQDAENKILLLTRDSFERFLANVKRLAITTQMTHHQRLKWQGEIVRYDQGRSSPDTVIRYQDEYLNARKLELQAKVAVEMANLDLDYAQGHLAR